MPLKTLDLNGRWEFKEYPESARRMRDLEAGRWLPAAVPSSIYTCLIEAGQIDSSDLCENPEHYAWISEKSWVFKKTFDLPETILTADRIDLVCEGLDTVSHIWLNEKLIARTDNMFLAWRFDITPHLKPGTNALLIKFGPAQQAARQRMDRCGSLSDRIWGDRHRVYLRKAQYQFGSPYNPTLPGCGIWRPVSLEAVQTARIKDIHIRTIECSQHYADVRIAVSIDKTAANPCKSLPCDLRINGEGLNLEKTIHFPPHECTHTTVTRIDRPVLWWPNGYGVPHLYTLTASLRDNDQCLDEKQTSFGVRTIHLRQDSDTLGQSFEFVVNEQPIYIKGMHWLPGTPFPGNLSKETCEKNLTCFQKAAGNMLRVWAGGYYESSDFYALCDRLGILVWQDFMFAEAYYPDRNWFLEDVRTEAEQIIERLRNHSSIAVWCGNSRCDRLHAAGQLGRGRKFYGKEIYHRILPDLLKELDPGRDYIPTASGDCSGDSLERDIHIEDSLNTGGTSAGEVPRFCDSFGCRSLPNRPTLLPDRPLLKNTFGKEVIPAILQKCGQYFAPPQDMEELTAQTQVVQARLAKRFVERMRALQKINSGWLMMTWNECWPAISFSSIDYRQNPKAVYFYALRFMHPLLVTLLPDPVRHRPGRTGESDPSGAVVLNDRAAPITATLAVQMMDLEGTLLDQICYPVSLGPFQCSRPFSLPRNMMNPPNPSSSLLVLALQQDERLLAENTFLFLPDKWIDWPALSIDCLLEPQDSRNWIVKLTSKSFVRDLSIQPPAPAELSDNYFDLLPNRTRVLSMRFKEKAPPIPVPFRLNSVSVSGAIRV